MVLRREREASVLIYQKELSCASDNKRVQSQSMVFARGPQRRGIGASQQHPVFTPLINVTF